MKIGMQLVAPEGWKMLAKGVIYHFLKSDPSSERVLLVQFEWEGKGQAKANLYVLRRKEFEKGVLDEAILPCQQQSTLPPWLSELEGQDLLLDSPSHSKSKLSRHERVEQRYTYIEQAIRESWKIFTSRNPQAEINRYARECTPPQNEARFRLWFFTYLCFGQNLCVLLPPLHRSGRWDRTMYPEKKFGAPSLAYGKDYGYGSSKWLIEACCESYRKRAKLGKTMSSIYEDAMLEDFKCKTVKGPNGMKIYVQAEGRPFPTYWQFRYRVMQGYGKEAVQKALYGSVRYRSKIARSRGRFSEEVANLLERVEADGYYIIERPKGYIDGETLKPICVVVIRDVLSGKKVGIGFSFGAERSSAYRMALFSMAVPKDFLYKLYGITYVPDEWVSQGLPSHFSLDRGPGARKDLIEEIEKRFPIRDIAPSWSGQSKATVESSHPRNIKIEGKPTYIQSSLTPIELVRREIMELIRYNNSADMSDRIDPDRDMVSIIPTPNELYKYYNKLYRNDAQPISIEDAVRTFLTLTELQFCDDGVYLKGRLYFSDELQNSEEFERFRSTKPTPTKVHGYVLDMCVRYIWIEIAGRLLMLSAKLRIRGDDEVLWHSLEELNQWEENQRIINSAFRVHQKAINSECKARFEEDTGKHWDAGQRRSGRAKRNSAYSQKHNKSTRKVA